VRIGPDAEGSSLSGRYGGHSMVAPIRRLLLAHPRDAFRSQQHATATWVEQGRQLRALLAGAVDEVEVVQLPHWRGEASCLHLMSFVSLIDRDLALVYSPLLPVPFRQ
jgi:N-dimethylarginine dimethylaminohydrolase